MNLRNQKNTIPVPPLASYEDVNAQKFHSGHFGDKNLHTCLHWLQHVNRHDPTNMLFRRPRQQPLNIY